MAQRKSANFSISNQDELKNFVNSLTASSGKRSSVKATVNKIDSLDFNLLKDLEESIFLSDAKITYNLKGDVNLNSAALLSPRFKRTGFVGRNIDLKIPSSISGESRSLIIDRVSGFAKSDYTEKVKELISQGASITMEDAKMYGLIDQTVNLEKPRRGSFKNQSVVVSGSGNAGNTGNVNNSVNS